MAVWGIFCYMIFAPIFFNATVDGQLYPGAFATVRCNNHFVARLDLSNGQNGILLPHGINCNILIVAGDGRSQFWEDYPMTGQTMIASFTTRK